MCEAVPHLPKSTTRLTEMAEEDVREAIMKIENKIVSFKSWDRVSKEYIGKSVTHTKLVEKQVDKSTFVQQFMRSLPAFKAHCSRVQEQYLQIKILGEAMPLDHAILCMDYSENWNCQYLKGVTSAYYSKDQITLHPMVVKKKNEDGSLMVESFVRVTGVTSHSFPTTWTFVKALVEELKKTMPDISTIHLVTDSPSSQYRNRYAVQMILKSPTSLNLITTWNWLESGHGKGPCDGVGGGMKKLADRLVKTNVTIQSASDFCTAVSPATKVKLIHITSEDIQTSAMEIDAWECPSVKGLMTMHQVTAHDKKIFVRETSCYRNECCFVDGKLTPTCNGWLQTKVEDKEDVQYEDSDDTMSDISESSSEDDVTLKDLVQQWREDDTDTDDDVPLLQLLPLMKDKEKEKQKK